MATAENNDADAGVMQEDSLEDLGVGADGGVMSLIFSEAAALAAEGAEAREDDATEAPESAAGTHAGGSPPGAGKGPESSACAADTNVAVHEQEEDAAGEDSEGDAEGTDGKGMDKDKEAEAGSPEAGSPEAIEEGATADGAADELTDGNEEVLPAHANEEDSTAEQVRGEAERTQGELGDDADRDSGMADPVKEGTDVQAGEAQAEPGREPEEDVDDFLDGPEAEKETKKQTFPSFLEAQLDDMLAKHTAKHPPPPPDGDSDDAGAEPEETSVGAANTDTEGLVHPPEQQETPVEAVDADDATPQMTQIGQAGGSVGEGDLEAAAVKIQALARGGRDRRQVKDLQRGELLKVPSIGVVVDDAAEAGPAEGDVNDAGAAGRSDMEEGARSSDDDGGRGSDDEEQGQAPEEKEVGQVNDDGALATYSLQPEEESVVKIQALARGRQDRQRVRHLLEERAGETQLDTQHVSPDESAGAQGESGVRGCLAEEQGSYEQQEEPGAHEQDEEAQEDEQHEEPDLPRLSFAKPIALKTSPARPADQTAPVLASPPAGDVEPDDPPLKLSFAAPIQNVKRVDEGAPVLSAGGEGEDAVHEGEQDGRAVEEQVTFAAEPVQPLDIWMAGCDGDETADAGGEEADEDCHGSGIFAKDDGRGGEEDEEGEQDEHVAHCSDRGVGGAPSPLASVSRSPMSDGLRVGGQQSGYPDSDSPAISHRAVVEDKIMEGLKEKLRAIEAKVQELQQQLLERLSGAGDHSRPGFSFEDAEGEEEAVAALNERVEKLIRMRAQIMLAIEHQKTITAARPPSAARGTASPRARLDARALSSGAASPGALSQRSSNQAEQSALGSSSRRNGSLPRQRMQENKVPPALQLPKDVSLKPIRGTSRVPPAMFQRNKPPPPSHLYEKYPEEPRVPSREVAMRAPLSVRKASKGKAGKQEAGSPRAPLDYDKYNAQIMDEGVHVSYKVLSDKVANRTHGRVATVAAQEREMRFAKEQSVLKTLVRNQVQLENRYTKEADRAAKLQRINHGGAARGGARHLFNGSGPF